MLILKKANKSHLSNLDRIDNPLQDVLDKGSLTNIKYGPFKKDILFHVMP